MSIFINPKGETKEKWLDRCGFKFSTLAEAIQECPDDCLVVGLMDKVNNQKTVLTTFRPNHPLIQLIKKRIESKIKP